MTKDEIKRIMAYCKLAAESHNRNWKNLHFLTNARTDLPRLAENCLELRGLLEKVNKLLQQERVNTQLEVLKESKGDNVGYCDTLLRELDRLESALRYPAQANQPGRDESRNDVAALAGEFIRPADNPADELVDNGELLEELDKIQASLPDFAPAQRK